MNTKMHTAGPWIAHKYPTERGNGYQIQQQSCRVVSIACVSPWTSDRQDAIAEANARLIAAAPELLEALENLLKMVEFVGLAETPIELVPKIERTGEAARVAIANATQPR